MTNTSTLVRIETVPVSETLADFKKSLAIWAAVLNPTEQALANASRLANGPTVMCNDFEPMRTKRFR